MSSEIQALLRTAQARLAATGIDSAAIDAKRLLMAATGLSATEILITDICPQPEALSCFEQMMARRLQREPVSRILGRRGFWSLEMEISGAVLDPRPETEILVRTALDVLPREEAACFLDLGCGSGCVLLSILSERPQAFGVGTDKSLAALQLARSNAARAGLGEQSAFVCANWLDALVSEVGLIVANPPYIRSGELAGLEPEVRLYDPVLALDGGPDGLDPLRAICGKALSRLQPGGWLLTELGAGSEAAARTVFEQAGFGQIRRVSDLAGWTRVLGGRRL